MNKSKKISAQATENDVNNFSFANYIKSIKVEEKDGVKVGIINYHDNLNKHSKLETISLLNTKLSIFDPNAPFLSKDGRFSWGQINQETFSLKDTSLADLHPDFPSFTKYGIHTKSMLDTLSRENNPLLKAFIYPDFDSISSMTRFGQHNYRINQPISNIASGINNLASQYLSGEIFRKMPHELLNTRGFSPTVLGSITYPNALLNPLKEDVLNTVLSTNKQIDGLAGYLAYDPSKLPSYSLQGTPQHFNMLSNPIISSLAESLTTNRWSTSKSCEKEGIKFYKALPIIPKRDDLEERLSKLETQMLQFEKNFIKANDREEREYLKTEVEKLWLELQSLKECSSNEEPGYLDKYDVMKILNISERTYYRYKDGWKSYKVGSKLLYKESEIRQAINQFLK